MKLDDFIVITMSAGVLAMVLGWINEDAMRWVGPAMVLAGLGAKLAAG